MFIYQYKQTNQVTTLKYDENWYFTENIKHHSIAFGPIRSG